jgi:uncharacterized membrane protein YgdD (TMEM256/DUF423 family)
MPSVFLKWGAFLGFLGVALGAFGAHALKKTLSPEMIAIYQTGVMYHLFHAVMLCAVGTMAHRLKPPHHRWAGNLFIFGIFLFSGSLYILAISGIKSIGMITPLGGLALLAGWLCVFLGT